MQKSLSLGFDTERPYGKLAETEEGRQFRERQLAFIGLMNEKFDAANVPRTHFILTSYLDSARHAVGTALLRERYRKDHPLQDLQQHSHSHGIMSPLPGVERPVMSTENYIADLKRANDVMEDILSVTPQGLRTPYGYEHDLSGRTDILQGLREIGITYVSADLGMKRTLEGAVTRERQPHTYAHVGFPGIAEVPAHGRQDVVFTREKQKQLYGSTTVPTSNDIEMHFMELLRDAESLGADRVSIALCLHPWAVMEYDPQLTILLGLVATARRRGFDVVSYRDVADRYRKG